MSGPARRATAGEVAALAGVSAQTVSRVANGAPNVRPATRDKVLAAMAQLGYAPNSAAQALRSGRPDTLGVVAHHLGRTGEARTLEAVIASAHRHGHGVTVADAADGSLPEVQSAVTRIATRVAGLVVLGLETADIASLRVPPLLPVVVADSRSLPFPTVGLDQASGAHLAVAHLLGLGHATVHHVSGPASSLQATQRRDAWQAALEAAGRPVPDVLPGDWSPASGYRAGKVIAADPTVTAVFAANDEMAAGVLRALHEAGRDVPGEVSVVGFDDIIAEYLWPPLTTVRQDFGAIGERLVSTLVHRLGQNPNRGAAEGNSTRETTAGSETGGSTTGSEASGSPTASDTGAVSRAHQEPGLIRPTLVPRASCARPRA